MHARLVVRQIQHLHGDMQEYTKGRQRPPAHFRQHDVAG